MVPSVRAAKSKLQLLRKKAFHDLFKAKAEINKLELESGDSHTLSNEGQYSKPTKSAPKPSQSATSRIVNKVSTAGPSASWAAIPVPATVQRNQASTQEASIVSELLRDIVSESLHPAKSHLRSAMAQSGAGLKSESLHTETYVKPSHFLESNSELNSRARSLGPSISRGDDALTADQAEKEAEAVQLREKREAECEACLTKWSSGARYCVMTVCHLHTSASLLAAPQVVWTKMTRAVCYL